MKLSMIQKNQFNFSVIINEYFENTEIIPN